MWTKEEFIQIADKEIEKIKARSGKVYSQFGLNFGTTYNDDVKFIKAHYENLGYVVTTHICKRRLADISIQFNSN